MNICITEKDFFTLQNHVDNVVEEDYKETYSLIETAH